VLREDSRRFFAGVELELPLDFGIDWDPVAVGVVSVPIEDSYITRECYFCPLVQSVVALLVAGTLGIAVEIVAETDNRGAAASFVVDCFG